MRHLDVERAAGVATRAKVCVYSYGLCSYGLCSHGQLYVERAAGVAARAKVCV